jgi:hypothetical protein
MNKAGVAAAALAGGALALAGAMPGQAAGPYTIKASRVAGGDGDFVFGKSGCKSEVANNLNGIDTRFIDISGMGIAGRSITVHWTATNTVGKTLSYGSGLIAHFYDANCGQFFGSLPVSGINPGDWTFTVPAGMKWLTVTANGLTDTSFSF